MGAIVLETLSRALPLLHRRSGKRFIGSQRLSAAGSRVGRFPEFVETPSYRQAGPRQPTMLKHQTMQEAVSARVGRPSRLR